MKVFKKLLFLLTTNELKRSIFILFMIMIMALFDMLGVASILPFISVLTNPSLVETNSILNMMFQISKMFGVENNQDFIFVLGMLVFALLTISLIIKVFTIYMQARFVQMLQFSIGERLLERYLYQPYSWFLNRHSADLGKTILSEVGTIIGSGISPLMELIAKSIATIAIIILLVIADPKLALIIGFSLGGAYILIFYFIRHYLKRIGEKRFKNNQLRFKAVSEIFGAAKEVKLGGLEEIYIKSFSIPSKILASVNASSNVIGQLPRFILELIAFGGILLIVLYNLTLKGNLNNSLPIISLYVFAGYRLMPALQQVYSSFTQLTFVGPSINKLADDIKSLEAFNKNRDFEILSLNKNITLENIYYNYPNASKTVLKNVSINISAKTTVGLMGATGSGKTTTVDILLGLLEPQKGFLKVDGKIITKQNARSWQRSIGYVPQHIYLADDTVAANIAFGSNATNFNQKAVEEASKIANLHDFIMNELPQKYETKIGERGVRLSGGQRQRIGIARSLYNKPKLLVLDEATSSLDNMTERTVMEAVRKLQKKITIILIAHRLTTLEKCDNIFLLDKGELKGQGTYQELKKNNEIFQKMNVKEKKLN